MTALSAVWSKIIAQPARITVLRSPSRLPKNPLRALGFQATATRGEKLCGLLLYKPGA